MTISSMAHWDLPFVTPDKLTIISLDTWCPMASFGPADSQIKRFLDIVQDYKEFNGTWCVCIKKYFWLHVWHHCIPYRCFFRYSSRSPFVDRTIEFHSKWGICRTESYKLSVNIIWYKPYSTLQQRKRLFNICSTLENILSSMFSKSKTYSSTEKDNFSIWDFSFFKYGQLLTKSSTVAELWSRYPCSTGYGTIFHLLTSKTRENLRSLQLVMLMYQTGMGSL